MNVDKAGRRYNREKKAYGGDRKSSGQSDHLKETERTATKLSKERDMYNSKQGGQIDHLKQNAPSGQSDHTDTPERTDITSGQCDQKSTTATKLSKEHGVSEMGCVRTDARPKGRGGKKAADTHSTDRIPSAVFFVTYPVQDRF